MRLRAVSAVALLLGGALAGAFLVEVGLRARQYVKYGTVRSTVYDTTMTTDLIAGLRIPVPGGRTRTIRINTLGFRGPELEVPKPEGRIRVAFLGASTTFCAEAGSNEATWPHLVWESLKRKWPDREFDYVNAAVPGYRVEDSLKNIERRVKNLQPDVVVIYHATNDLSADTRALAQQQGLVGASDETGGLSRWSLAWFLLEKNLQVWSRQRAAARKDVAHLAFDPEVLSRGFHQRLLELVAAARGVARIVVLATFSPKVRRGQSAEEQLRACNTSLYYMPYMSVEGILQGFEEYNRVIRQVARETGAVLVDGEDAIPGTDEYFSDSVHFKDAGCQRMSRRVVDTLFASEAVRALVADRQTKRWGSPTPVSAGR